MKAKKVLNLITKWLTDYSVSNGNKNDLSDDETKLCISFGKRIATLASKL